MFRILQAVYDRIMALRNGIATNLAQWVGQPDTPETLDGLLQQLRDKDAEIKALDVQLRDKRAEARTLADTIAAAADQTERRASGIHATDTARLADYNMPVPGASIANRQPVQVPAKGVVRKIDDDDDGQGFIVRFDKLDDAKHYEVERSEADGPMTFLRTTTKTKFTDDDVKPGIRYHYRMRGGNARGAGEWSEPVGAIQ